MEQVRADLAEPGTAWFSACQTAGKGQRGKSWVAEPGAAISLSLAIKPPVVFRVDRFHYNAIMALACLRFLEKRLPEGLSVKWPNDLYFKGHKLGGILTENIISGNTWHWAITGIGINVNQISFPEQLPNAVSMKMATGKSFDVENLARELHLFILSELAAIGDTDNLLQAFNSRLYKRDQTVKMKTGSVTFNTSILGVDEFGRLMTKDAVERFFSVGDVEWINS